MNGRQFWCLVAATTVAYAVAGWGFVVFGLQMRQVWVGVAGAALIVGVWGWSVGGAVYRVTGWTVSVRYMDGSSRRYRFWGKAEALQFRVIAAATPTVAGTGIVRGRAK